MISNIFKQRKSNKGITLIALVITIVVMLILAGVTINLTLGENGIFTTAQKAAKNYTDAQEKELAYLEGFTNQVNNIVNPAPLGTIIKTENNINYIADGAGNTIPVPVGFSPITTEDQGTKLTGFVIKNDTDGNEFVWVPVEGMSYRYERVAWARDGWSDSQTLEEATGEIKVGTSSNVYTEALPSDEETSVATYGGFYIGRYEAGVKDYETKNATSDGSTTWTAYTGDNTTLVIQKNQEVWNYITRDRALTEATNLYNKTENNVTSKLCSSYAWDTALKFIETQNSKYPTNSAGGNYTVETGGTGELQPTGYHAINNIYDMGGNASEWTTESYSNTNLPYGNRSGFYNGSASDAPAASRFNNNTTVTRDYITFRVTLYM